MFIVELLIVLGSILIGVRRGGIFLGMAAGAGLALLVFAFKLAPGTPPHDVILIIMSVVIAASTLQAAGGLDYLVRLAEKVLRRNPNNITFVAPFVTYVFTFLAGTGYVLFSLLPVISEVARESGVRPERPISISVVAAQLAITSCPISAATVTLVAMLSPYDITLVDMLMILIPSALIGVFAGALAVSRFGKELKDDPVYIEKVKQGLIPPLKKQENTEIVASKEAKISVALFVLVAVLIVLCGTFPFLRPAATLANGKTSLLSMSYAIEILMLVASFLMVLLCKIKPNDIITGSVFRSGMMGAACMFGLAWAGDTLVSNNMPVIKANLETLITAYPWTFAFALFACSTLIISQAASTRALMPLGLLLGIPPQMVIGMFHSVNGCFFLANSAVVIAGISFDQTGTTKIGKFLLNHSFMLPGVVTVVTAVVSGILLANVLLG